MANYYIMEFVSVCNITSIDVVYLDTLRDSRLVTLWKGLTC